MGKQARVTLYSKAEWDKAADTYRQLLTRFGEPAIVAAAPLPDAGQFLVSSYDPRWLGKTVDVRGTVSRVDVDKQRHPPYATIHFKEARNDQFTAYTPNSEILDEMFPTGAAALVGRLHPNPPPVRLARPPTAVRPIS
jgi:hypothetical protein